MVKADYKRDYYADLELPTTADQETIKRRFRELAKQYHPDRNPGREVDVVPKFQAIQQAHEILADPAQKVRYDAERAKLNQPRDTESPTFRKPAPPRRTDSGFPASGFSQSQSNAGRRDASASRYAPQFAPSRSRPTSSASPGADRFAQFARAAPQTQQWDRSRFEEAARAEGLRGMKAMRGGAVPQSSPMRSRPPTAPKASPADPYVPGTDPSPGYPGLNRSTSRRDGPTSAYAHVHADRPPSSGIRPGPEYRAQDGNESYLRKNSSFQNFSDLRPDLSRSSSRYAQTPGERTDPNSNIGRSESVKDPANRKWHDRERGPFSSAASNNEAQSPRPRPRSHSPQARPRQPEYHYESESTSSGEEATVPPQDRKKQPLRRPRTFFSNTTSSSINSEDPGLTGYFPKTNYTQVVEDTSTYDFPKPDDKSPPVRRPFSMFAPETDNEAPTYEQPPSQPGNENVSGHSDNIPKENSTGQRRGFDPSEWQGSFDNNTDMFNPPESNSKDRKSPSKGSRSLRGGQSRAFNIHDGRRDAINGDSKADMAAGIRHVDPDTQSAFVPGKLSSDFAERINGSHRPTANHQDSFSRTDEMDVDSPSALPASPIRVTVEEEVDSQPSPQQDSTFNLNGFKSTGPFAPSNTGLHDLDDLTNSLPFQSRPAETLEAFHATSSTTLRELKLPRPPKCPSCPDDVPLTTDVWTKYITEMSVYMNAWKKFNGDMLSHFNARQEAAATRMYPNWLKGSNDGASAESFKADPLHVAAGYGTYMSWLEDDRKCRTWWDVACEEHRMCMEGLGNVRKRVRELSKGAAP